MRRATKADLPAIRAFLHERIETSMFPLANLRDHGFAGDAPRSVDFWLAEDGGRLTDVLCQTREGVVMPQCPSADVAAQRAALAGREILGLIGERGQVRALQSALGATQWAAALDEDETLFALAPDDLVIPPGKTELRPVAAADPSTVTDWMAAYVIEALHGEEGPAAEEARRRYENAVAGDTYAVLCAGETPVALTGFNARLPEAVQVGGVYTPPALRGQGHARRAVALHLAQAFAQGARRAILFARDPAAIAAYRAIGFRPRGAFSLCIFRDRQVCHG